MADLLDPSGTDLADRYEIERELGAGGMATVHLARDRKYDRQVAVKVLRPELAAAIGADRFLREIRITAQLNHPLILPVLDSGEADGKLFYVMPFVAGGSLRERLREGAVLPLDEALHITAQVAAAVDHAHRHGAVHRDLKPENILFSEGHAIVADFGIARAVATAGGAELTRSGFPLGTPGYMSPEQAAGNTHLDERTDVFGLGCVVYEMLVGQTPEMWPTEEAQRLGRFVDASPEHTDRLDRLPGRVQQALVKALAFRPADRFPGPTEFAEALIEASEGTAKVNPDQAERVLRRSAEIQLEEPTGPGALSLGGIEQVAAEVGIPPEHVRRAAAEVAESEATPGGARPASAASGRPGVLSTGETVAVDKKGKKVAAERVVDRQVAPSEHGALVTEIQRVLGLAGHVSTLPDSLTWTSAAQGAGDPHILVTVAAREGQTEIHVEESFKNTPGSFFAPPAAAAGGAWAAMLTVLGVLGEPSTGLGIAGLVAAGFGTATASATTVAASIWRRFKNRSMPRVEGLADSLEALARAPLPRDPDVLQEARPRGHQPSAD
jgi:hypothetical protein